MYSRRKWWEETPVAPEEKAEQIDLKSDSGWYRKKKKKKKKRLQAFGKGEVYNQEFLCFELYGETWTWLYGQWTFLFCLFFQPPASFKPELSWTEWLLSWFYRIALNSSTGITRRYQRLWIKASPCVPWDRNSLFCSRFAFDTKSLRILLKSEFGMTIWDDNLVQITQLNMIISSHFHILQESLKKVVPIHQLTNPIWNSYKHRMLSGMDFKRLLF